MNPVIESYDVFVSAPMAGLRSPEKYRVFRAEVLAVVRCLEELGLTAFFAGRDAESPDAFDEPDASVIRDIEALKRSRYFLLIYPERVVSSVLVEAGYALSMGMKAVYFVRDVKHLPFLLRHLDRVHPVKIYEYETAERIVTLLRRHKGKLFEPWREPAPPAPATITGPSLPSGPRHLRAGELVGPYTLVEELGEGGFGIVWLAERRTALATTRFALKFPHAAASAPGVAEAIRREASVWVQAGGHPNVLPVIEAECYDERLVIVTPYAPEGSLDRWLQRHGGMAPDHDTALELITGILAGLGHLHARGFVHRDLKPGNVVLESGIPRIADFGLARLVGVDQTFTVGGTPAYMAPEAWDGERAETADIWAVGVMLYEMLAGRRPFPMTSVDELRRAVRTTEPPSLPENVSVPLRDIISRALRKDPTARFASALEMHRELSNL